jgi:hypothetical protein
MELHHAPVTFGLIVRDECGVLLVLQAAISDCVSFDPFSFQQDGLGASKVDVSRDEIAQALVIAAMVVVIDECVDLGLEVAG